MYYSDAQFYIKISLYILLINEVYFVIKTYHSIFVINWFFYFTIKHHVNCVYGTLSYKFAINNKSNLFDKIFRQCNEYEHLLKKC